MERAARSLFEDIVGRVSLEGLQSLILLLIDLDARFVDIPSLFEHFEDRRRRALLLVADLRWDNLEFKGDIKAWAVIRS